MGKIDRRGKSREYLAKIGAKTRFTAENAAEMGRRGRDSMKYEKALKEKLEAILSPDIMAKILDKGVQKGDPRLIDIALKILGAMPADKVEQNISQTVTVKDDWRKIAQDLGIKTGE